MCFCFMFRVGILLVCCSTCFFKFQFWTIKTGPILEDGITDLERQCDFSSGVSLTTMLMDCFGISYVKSLHIFMSLD